MSSERPAPAADGSWADASPVSLPMHGPRRPVVLVVSLIAVVLLAVGAAGAALVLRARDPVYDDTKALRERPKMAEVAIPKDMALPEVKEGTPLSPEDLVLVVSKTNVRFEGREILPVPADATHGFEAKYKRSGPTDLYVVPLANVLEWAHQYPPAAARKDRPPTLTLLIDRDVPYRMVTEIHFTIAMAGWTPRVGGIKDGKVVGLDAAPPRAGPARGP